MAKPPITTNDDIHPREGTQDERGLEGGMFLIETDEDSTGRVMVVGKPSRKRAVTFINIPVSAELRERMGSQVVGSLAMGSGALLEWALGELKRRGISIKAKPR